MKKQLLTGALALSVLMGSTGMAFAADMPAAEMSKATTISVQSKITADTNAIPDTAAMPFKISDQKAYTADSYSSEIEKTKAEFDTMVKNKDMSREDANKILDRMEQDLQKIKAGSLTLYYYDMLDESGKVVGKISMATAITDANTDGDKTGNFTITLKDGNQTKIPAIDIVPAKAAK